VHLFELAVQDKKNITFVGHSTSGDAGGPNGPAMVAGKPFPQDNEGHSGWTIAGSNGIDKRVPEPALKDKPHIVLLHIGTNDLYNTGMPTAEMPKRLGTLVDHIVTAVPDALVVVAKLTPTTNATWAATLETYNKAIPGVVEERAKAGKHVILGDMNTGFDTKNLGDVVHPNKAGYDFMAEKWYPLIKDYLPAAK
jgi:lysophospholipase L1-like esterase